MSEISVIVPVYNGSKTIRDCLESILSQTFRNFEIIVVNDGSTDNTAEILSAYSDKIKIINQENRGAAATRNKGAEDCFAPFIIFCDADIVTTPKMFEKMYEALKKNPEAAFAYSSFKFGFKTFKLWPFDLEKLKKTPYIHTTSLIRREFFPGFDESLKRFQDWDLFLTISEQGHSGQFIPEVLFTVKSGGTISSWLPKSFYKLFNFSKKVKKYKEAEKIIKQKHNL